MVTAKKPMRQVSLPRIKYRDLDLRLPRIQIVEMTPEDARDLLLKIKAPNRNLNLAAVREWARLMCTGLWREDHPVPIVISYEMLQLDGEHRLTALSDLPRHLAALRSAGYHKLEPPHTIAMRVETGADPAVRRFLDNGLVRRHSDQVDLVGEATLNRFACSVCLAGVSMHTHTGRTLVDEVQDYFLTHTDAVVAIGKLWKKQRYVGQMPIALAAVEYWERNAAKAEEFVMALFSPDSDVQQARMFRDWLLRTAGEASYGANGRRSVYGRAVNAMRYHLEDRPLRAIREGRWEA